MYVLITSESLRVNINLTNFASLFYSTGTQPDETLYNALLSVYVQNSYIFNPLEVLEEMELRNVDPNRVRNFGIRIFSTLNY